MWWAIRGAEAGIGLEEGLHAILVAGQDHHQVVALVLHHLQQHLDRFLAVVALVLGAVEVVGLVDEEHAAHRLLQDLLGLGRRVADVLADQVVARGHHQMALGARSRACGGSSPCACATVVLPVPGRPVKLMCSVGRSALEPDLLAQPRHQQQRGDLADARLHRRQPDQLAVELVQHLLARVSSLPMQAGSRSITGSSRRQP